MTALAAACDFATAKAAVRVDDALTELKQFGRGAVVDPQTAVAWAECGPVECPS
jgi:hypothetical protein